MPTFERIMVWQFDAAPAELQGLHNRGYSPRWLALIPASIHGPDLARAIREQTSDISMDEYRTLSGDIVYVGSSGLAEILHAVAPSLSEQGPREQRSQE